MKGLCGDNDGEPENDQKTPKGCLLQKPEEFSATYALTDEDDCDAEIRRNFENAKKSPCSYDSARLGNIISN